MADSTILYSKGGSIAQIALNRPRVINAYNIQMRDELYEVLEAVRDDPGVRAVVLRGEGERGFCAGADLTEFGTSPSVAVARQVRWERDIWGLFLSIRKPLIAALHGYVIGSGVEIACLCDIRIASEDAVFSMPEVALGMVPAAGGTQMLPRVIGPGHALDMILTNRRVSAKEAMSMGLVVHRVVPRELLLDEAANTAQELASCNPQALTAAKTAILEGMDLPLDKGLALEARLAQRIVMQGSST
jgi:enoyl-CoA hydratase/carnithine racemase